jgi:hypothetical protein
LRGPARSGPRRCRRRTRSRWSSTNPPQNPNQHPHPRQHQPRLRLRLCRSRAPPLLAGSPQLLPCCWGWAPCWCALGGPDGIGRLAAEQKRNRPRASVTRPAIQDPLENGDGTVFGLPEARRRRRGVGLGMWPRLVARKRFGLGCVPRIEERTVPGSFENGDGTVFGLPEIRQAQRRWRGVGLGMWPRLVARKRFGSGSVPRIEERTVPGLRAEMKCLWGTREYPCWKRFHLSNDDCFGGSCPVDYTHVGMVRSRSATR